MKGATEVPSTITVIIIQYTLIKRMKCELAFPISPTYCLNVKYSSHGLSPWKHTGAVGISGYNTASPGVEEWRDLRRRVMKSGEQHRFIPQKLAQAFWGEAAAFSLSLLPFSFLAQGIYPSPKDFLLFTSLRPWALLWIMGFTQPRGIGPVSSKAEKV